VSPEWSVTLLAHRHMLPPGELRCAAVECYRLWSRQQQMPAKSNGLAQGEQGNW